MKCARFLCSTFVWLMVAAGSVAEAASTLAYVTNTGSNTISVIDTSTQTVVDTIVVGVAPAGIVATPDGASLYVANSGSGTVSVIETAAKSVVATIPVGVAPGAIAISPDGSRVYVANTGSDSVSVVDTASNTTVATVSMGPDTFVAIYPVGPGGMPFSHLAVAADGSRVYVTNTYPYNQPLSSSLKVIDTATNTVSGTVQLSQRNSGSVELSPDGTTGYVAGWFGYFQTFSLATNTQTQAFSLSGGNSGISLAGIAVPQNSPFVYVAASEHNKVYVVDPVAQTWAPINVGAYPTDVSITPDAAFAYVTNRADSTVSVIDISNNSVIATVAVGPHPSEVAFAPAVVPYGVNLQYDPTKAHKIGSTLPLKIQLIDAAGANVSSPSIAVTAVRVFLVSTSAPGLLEDSGNANPDFNFRYTDGQYVFNLSLKGFSQGTYGLDFTVSGDPTTHTLYFQTR